MLMTSRKSISHTSTSRPLPKRGSLRSLTQKRKSLSSLSHRPRTVKQPFVWASLTQGMIRTFKSLNSQMNQHYSDLSSVIFPRITQILFRVGTFVSSIIRTWLKELIKFLERNLPRFFLLGGFSKKNTLLAITEKNFYMKS